jgi:hypothetical protein
MMSPRAPSALGPFASKTLSDHLLRGVAAAVLLTAAFKLGEARPFLSLLSGLAALVMLRGCPMCWTMGLIETWAARRTR